MNNINIFFLLLLTIIINSCSNTSDKKSNSSSTNVKSIDIDTLKSSKRIDTIIKIIHLEKKHKKVESEEKLDCSNWNLNKLQIESIFPKMERVEPREVFLLCYDHPCYYIGKAIYKEALYDISISSASFIELSLKDELETYIMKDKNSLFLEPCNCCE